MVRLLSPKAKENKNNKKEEEKEKWRFKTTMLIEKFGCMTEDVHKIFLDENKQIARISKEVGGQFGFLSFSLKKKHDYSNIEFDDMDGQGPCGPVTLPLLHCW